MTTKKHVFSSIEKDLFKDLLKKYAPIIENKCTNGASLHKKKAAWNQLALEYNASPHVTVQVTSQQLRRLWMNLKQRHKEALTKRRHHRLATEGGPPISDSDIDADIAQIAPALIVGKDEAVDSDTTAESAAVTATEMELESSALPSTSSTAFMFPDLSQPSSAPVLNYLRPPSPLPTIASNPSVLNLLPVSQCPPTRNSSIPQPSTLRSSVPRPPAPTSIRSFQRQKDIILVNEYEDRKRRADEIHALEIIILKEKIKEAQAKANLAEFLLEERIQTYI